MPYNDTPIRLLISVSPKMSEMSSTGRDSKVDMAVEDPEWNPTIRLACLIHQFLEPIGHGGSGR